MNTSSHSHGCRRLSAIAVLFSALTVSWCSVLLAADLGEVALYDGQRTEMLNTWGGAWRVGDAQGATLQSRSGPGGQNLLSLDMGPVKAGEARFVQCFATGFGPTGQYYQTRDLTPHERLDFKVQNLTHVPVRGMLQLKDYRDSVEHCAVYPFELSGTSTWDGISVLLSFANAPWKLIGQPDLSRVLTIDFLFEPTASMGSGQINLSDVKLLERGDRLDVDTSPLPRLVERLASRQWHALWAARNRKHGMIPNNSYQSTDAGLNTTAAMLWMLPAATRHRWVEQSEADRYVAQVLGTTDRLLDQAKYLPPRNVDWVTLKPSMLPEESVIDAAFFALALHQYQALPSTSPALRKDIARTQNRFDFASFACPTGWRMAYRYSSPYGSAGFTSGTYDGYTNEGNLTSLAAQLTPNHTVPIEKHWNCSTFRIRDGLVQPDNGPMVHSYREYRAPFAQALWNLFVDVRQRGVDSYPDGRLAVNPWYNFVCYEQGVMARLAQTGRPNLVQPDAGDDGSLTCYRQFSVYNNFGQSDLFMPWSASFALLAGADRAEASLRFQLRHGLHDPFGLADSAKWATGASQPYSISARHDFWNTSLSTMAFLEWLDAEQRASKSFAALPEVRVALDQVFPTGAKVEPAPAPPTRVLPASLKIEHHSPAPVRPAPIRPAPIQSAVSVGEDRSQSPNQSPK